MNSPQSGRTEFRSAKKNDGVAGVGRQAPKGLGSRRETEKGPAAAESLNESEERGAGAFNNIQMSHPSI